MKGRRSRSEATSGSGRMSVSEPRNTVIREIFLFGESAHVT